MNGSRALREGSVSVIMPAFNESEHIVKNLLEVVETFTHFGRDFEVIVVDDGSSDNTHLHAARALLHYPERVRVIHYDANRGKGNALVAGFCVARGENIVLLDADMDLSPSQLPVFFTIMESRGADAVIGSKWHPRSSVRYPGMRRLYSVCYYFAVRLLFSLPVRDTQTGLKLYKASLLRDVFPRLLSKRFAFDIETLAVAHALGYRIVDAPVTLRFQRQFDRVKLRHAWMTLIDTLAIFYRLRILRYYHRLTMLEVVRGIAKGTIWELSAAEAKDLGPVGGDAVDGDIAGIRVARA
jgi:glycosyltransferase involved in cell wall biosynthesis